jgi:formylglycine-generating enzyme required for sulfatase activity
MSILPSATGLQHRRLFGETLSGNVREWTRSLWGQYPYPSDVQERARREDVHAPDNRHRVLRSGAFYNLLRSVRCAYRFRSRPSYRYNDIGFRVGVLPAV